MPAIKSILDNSRPVLDQLEKKFPDTRIYEADLRVEAIAGLNSEYSFSIISASNSASTQVTPNENQLNKSDSFVATQVAFGIYKAGTSSTPTSVTPTQYASSILRTFPNPNVFTASGEALALESLYTNGYLNLSVDDNKYMNGYSLLRFRRAPQSQELVGSTATSNLPVARDQYDLQTSPYINLNRPIIFNGSSKIDQTINTNVAVNIAGTSSTNVLVVLYRGYLCVGVNTLQPRK